MVGALGKMVDSVGSLRIMSQCLEIVLLNDGNWELSVVLKMSICSFVSLLMVLVVSLGLLCLSTMCLGYPLSLNFSFSIAKFLSRTGLSFVVLEPSCFTNRDASLCTFGMGCGVLYIGEGICWCEVCLI